MLLVFVRKSDSTIVRKGIAGKRDMCENNNGVSGFVASWVFSSKHLNQYRSKN